MKKFFLLFLIAAATFANAQKTQIYSGKSGAINGYDPVAYFKDNKPVKGDPKFSYRWNDANWHFADKGNLDAFKANPEKYAPQYGGYCAYGCTKGYKAPTDPDAFSIVDNKLYLNYNKNVRETWQRDQAALIKKSDETWPKIKDSKPE